MARTPESKKIKTRRLKRACLILIGIPVAVLISTQSTEAASLFLSPNSKSVDLGESFSVTVFVSSPDQAMNAAEAVISFPPDKLRVSALSNNASIINLWTENPSFSQSAGTIQFSGFVLNPGFTGTNGRIITITFRAVGAGSAPVVFSSGSVLANDGRGTNILTNFGDANYFLSPAISPPPSPSPVAAKPVKAPSPPPQETPPEETYEVVQDNSVPSTEAKGPLTNVIKEKTIVLQTKNLSSNVQLLILVFVLICFFALGRLWQRLSSVSRELKRVEREKESLHGGPFSQELLGHIRHLEEVKMQRPLTAEEESILNELRLELNRMIIHK